MSAHDETHEHEHDDEPEDELEAAEAEKVERDVRKRLALAQVRQYGDPALRMRAVEVESFDEELERVSQRMLELMHDAQGIGLAATQIGILRRFFVFFHDGENHVLANPVIRRVGKETEIEDEGCLSLGPVRVPVERPTSVAIEGRDAAGEPVSLELDGISARLVQHELDHLDGKLIIDRTDSEARRAALKELRPRLLLRG